MSKPLSIEQMLYDLDLHRPGSKGMKAARQEIIDLVKGLQEENAKLKENAYTVIPFSELKEGQPILALAKHVVNWDYASMGQPDYGVLQIDDGESK